MNKNLSINVVFFIFLAFCTTNKNENKFVTIATNPVGAQITLIETEEVCFSPCEIGLKQKSYFKINQMGFKQKIVLIDPGKKNNQIDLELASPIVAVTASKLADIGDILSDETIISEQKEQEKLLAKCCEEPILQSDSQIHKSNVVPVLKPTRNIDKTNKFDAYTLSKEKIDEINKSIK